MNMEIHGDFSEEEKHDEDFVEEQSLLNEINRQLNQNLSEKFDYDEKLFTFSRRLDNLATVTIPQSTKVKREYQICVEESVDNIQN